MFDIKREVAGYESEIIALRRDFHENPEIGFKEFRTSQIIYGYLKKLDIEVKNIAKTGVVGIVRGTKERQYSSAQAWTPCLWKKKRGSRFRPLTKG